jgi:peptide/nickel transport system ATP-binding protein
MKPVLEVSELNVSFGAARAVNAVSLHVNSGETLCLVGESGCGKSAACLAVMGLLGRGARRTASHIRFQGMDLMHLSEREMARLRGNRMAMIFQDPMTSLNPAYTVASQMVEVLRRHRRANRRQALDRAVELLHRVGVESPDVRLQQFPHELSGGLRQRVMIAMSLMCEPDLLVADEPTTALDVTVQAQILRLLRQLQSELGLAMLLITHDLGVVAHVADRVSVMYGGEVVESAPVASLFARPAHPYTRGLLGCVPVLGQTRRDQPLSTIPGSVESISQDSVGCPLRNRCEFASAQCAHNPPVRNLQENHMYRCHSPAPSALERSPGEVPCH